MKKVLFLILGICLIPLLCNAQQNVRKIPFMPYVQGMGRTTSMPFTSAGGDGSSAIPEVYAANKQHVTTVFFEPASTHMPKGEVGKLAAIASRYKSGVREVSIVGFSTPDMHGNFVNQRMESVAAALGDLGVKTVRYHVEHRKSPVISPHRVEVYD